MQYYNLKKIGRILKKVNFNQLADNHVNSSIRFIRVMLFYKKILEATWELNLSR